MGVLDASRFRLVMCWKRFCGLWTLPDSVH
jgi:hypothetical protein